MKKRICALICMVAIVFSALSCGFVVAAEDKKGNTITVEQYNKTGVEYSYQDISENGLKLAKGETVSGNFNVEKAGNYNLKIYYKQESSTYGVTNVRISLDNTPVSEKYFSLKHIWRYADEYFEDAQKNQIAPKQELYTDKVYAVISDSVTNNAVKLELSAGVHTISVTALEEEFVVCGMELIEITEAPTYDEYYEFYQSKGAKKVGKDAAFYVEAEGNAIKSSKSIVIANDRASVSVTPYDPVLVRYNVIGGDSWNSIGDWLEWTVKVNESGFYGIMLHANQSTKINDNSYRSLTIDGKTPFKEAELIEFVYDRSWKNMVLGNKDGAYNFYFEKGKEYRIRLTACAGKTKELVEKVSELVTELNADYLEMLMITGSSPDIYRDYKFKKVIPETLESLGNICKELKKIEKEWYNYSEGGASIADIKQMYELLDDIGEDPDILASRMKLLTSYISSLQTWVSDRQEQPLKLDYIYFHSLDEKIGNSQGSFWKIIWHHIRQFIASFTTDYSAIGNTKNTSNKKPITVWLGADAAMISATTGGAGGRDQAQIVTRLVTNDFVATKGIPTNVKLVNAGTLLTAVLAGVGPDVALGLNQSTPVNYALRNSIVDLSKLDGLDDVLKQFDESAYEPFKLNGGLYALPQNQSWSMLFYRKDIIKSLGITTDDLTTWDSILKDVLPILQINYLEFGVPNEIGMYLSLLYQRGGQLYSDDHMTTLMNSPEGISAFTDYTNMFLESGLPVAFNFADRFRNGSMPIGVAGYTTFNQLAVFAPEIEGLWAMLPMPGTMQEDGTINNVITASTEGCGIFKTENLESSWEFLKWWVSADTQLTFSQELETLLGTAGRNPTANKLVREKLGWSEEFRTALIKQSENLIGIPEIAGGYYTPRYFSFAFTDVVYSGKNVNEVITQTKKEIDAEIATKTEELLGKEKKK